MTDSKTRIENCLTALVAFVKAQSNETLPGRLVDDRDWDRETKSFAPIAPKARKSAKPGHDDEWGGEIWTNINAQNWDQQLGTALGLDEEEFVDRCTQIARCFGCGVGVIEDYANGKLVVRIGIWS